MAYHSFASSDEEFKNIGGFKNLISGIHHVVLKKYSEAIIKGGCETLIGCLEAQWTFKVVDGLSAGCNVCYTTPMGGYFVSKSDGMRFNAENITKRVVLALDPTKSDWSGFDPEDLIGKEAELNMEAKINTDGTTSLYPKKVNWIRPWSGDACMDKHLDLNSDVTL